LNKPDADVVATTCEAYDLFGQLLIALPNVEVTSAIDVSLLKTGTYFLKINIKEQQTLNFLKTNQQPHQLQNLYCEAFFYVAQLVSLAVPKSVYSLLKSFYEKVLLDGAFHFCSVGRFSADHQHSGYKFQGKIACQRDE
jgi:hypothetical protein